MQGGHHEDHEGLGPGFFMSFMSFMLFMVKAVSGMEPDAPTRFALPNRQAGAPSAPTRLS